MGRTGGLVHRVSECATGASAMAAAAAAPATPEFVHELTVSVSWNWHGFPVAMPVVGSPESPVSWTHQAAHRPPNRPQLMMS